MLQELSIWIDLLTFLVALKSQVLKDVGENFVLFVEHINLVADCAFKLAILNVLSCNLRETREALPAAELMTALALEQVQLDHHAGGTLKVLRKLLEDVVWVKVLLDNGNYRCSARLIGSKHLFK